MTATASAEFLPGSPLTRLTCTPSLQSAEYYPNFPVVKYIRRFRSETRVDADGEEEEEDCLVDPEVVCFKSKMDRCSLTAGVMLMTCPHCLVLLGFSLLDEPEGVSVVGDILGGRDFSSAR